MDLSREILIGMIALSAFVLVVSGASLYTEIQISSGNACGCFIPIPLFIPFIASVGLFIGMLIYNLLFPDYSNDSDPRALLKVLESDERSLLEKVIEEGRVLQSDLVKKTDLSKVKVHRILKKLNERGIIEKKSHGKTNVVILDEDLKEVFQ